jgi:hypothetical protein
LPLTAPARLHLLLTMDKKPPSAAASSSGSTESQHVTGHKRPLDVSSLASEPLHARQRGDTPSSITAPAPAAPAGSSLPRPSAQSFHDVYRSGAFFSDKTKYIYEIENLGERGRLILAVFPRRFGKSTFLDTLAQYYDVRNKDAFEQLFGITDIGKNPTPLRSKFMVLCLDFSGLETSSYEAFNASFSVNLVDAIGRFCVRYGVSLPEARDGVALFEKLWRAVFEAQIDDPTKPGVRISPSQLFLTIS